jgi:hypothetical protein
VRVSSTILAAGVIFTAFAMGLVPQAEHGCLLGPATAQAQNLGQRVVMGSVLDADSAQVAGATVFLKNLKTKAIRSYNSDGKGRFRFAQVDMAEDHELWAEKGSKKSAVKTVSSWDSRKEFECELKIK